MHADDPWRQFPPARFTSANIPTYNIGFSSENLPAISQQQERFRIVKPGLTGEIGTVSLESEKFPGNYLRHKNFLMYLSPFEETNVFFKDATYWMKDNIFLDVSSPGL